MVWASPSSKPTFFLFLFFFSEMVTKTSAPGSVVSFFSFLAHRKKARAAAM
jgi:hypothetical protein